MDKTKHALIISFEGIEGTGKSTQCRLLSKYLKNKGLKVIVLREPGSSVIGEDIRRILLHGKGKLTSFSETLLFIAARCQLVEEKISVNLRKKDIIILDRFIDATLAYQGFGAGVDLKLIRKLNKAVAGDFTPNLTLLLDIEPKDGLIRSGRNDRFEKRKLSFHSRVRNGYLALAKSYHKRIKVISTKEDIKAVHKKICYFVDETLACANK
ncbi:MAG: dTMP kinase [Candidatus Omnitrophica bacterium]|nr:dTMP kinase [Candidatus Omnitrophota bacterium]